MRKMKRMMMALVLSAMALFLVGCGGHGYEGTYTMSVKGQDAHTQLLASLVPRFTVEIGKDYILNVDLEDREDFKSIKKKGDELQFTKEYGKTEILKIVDKNTLVQHEDGMIITFSRN